MADPAKHFHVPGGPFFVFELRAILRSRRTITLAYGLMFAFVAVTVFLVLSPSSNSSYPWLTNIFGTTTAATSYSGDSSRSQFSSIFAYFFPNPTHQYSSGSTPFPPPSASSPVLNSTSTGSNHTQSLVSPHEVPALRQNRTSESPSTNVSLPLKLNSTQGAVIVGSPPVLNRTQVGKSSGNSSDVETSAKNATRSSEITGQPPKLGHNQSFAYEKKNDDAHQKSTEKGVNSAGDKHNETASLPKEQGSPGVSGLSAKKATDDSLESLKNCDFFDGEWVKDDSYPLYKPGSCSLIDEQFNCILNGRPDKDYQKLKWKPQGCNLPRLNAGKMLELLRGKRLAFVGDSLNRNMWESLVCILRGSVKDQSKVYEANGRQIFRGEASYTFIFEDYDLTVEFFVSPFLVREWEVHEKNGSTKETLRLDLISMSCDQYKGADIIVFNTGHWWTHDKTSLGKDYYQEGSHVYDELNVLEAFRRALTTWGRWVDANIDPAKTLVFFRGYSDSHFSGGQWNSGGQCDSETQPIKDSAYLREYPPKMVVLERVLKGMKTPITYLNITKMTDYRKDGHPSIYRKQHLTDEERRSPLMYQDCSHWCLPGVPDSWNEILYAKLLLKLSDREHRQQQQSKNKHQQQQQKRP